MSLDQALVDQLGRLLPKMVISFATAKGEANPAQKQQLPVFESEDSRHQSDPQVHGKRSLHALRALLPEMLRKPEASEASEARKARKARGH